MPPLRTNIQQNQQHFALLEIVKGPFCWRIVALLVLSFLIWLSHREKRIFLQLSEDDHQLFKTVSTADNLLHRCYDADDPVEWKPVDNKCSCTDPLLSKERDMAIWREHHKRVDQGLASLRVKQQEQSNRYDLVMIGDSIIEFWNGTKQMGTIQAPEYRDVFETFFTRAGGGDLEALAVGSSGDTCNNILWQLQNGWLERSRQLYPRAWMIMVGTNDLGKHGCSKRNTLAGILHVAQFVHEQQPGVPIIVHALMPRSDHYEGTPASDYSLGKLWKEILWINRELKRFCYLHPEWIFLDVNNIFLQRVELEGHDTQGAVEINPSMMEDALHPSVQGYEAWGEKIVELFEKPPFKKPPEQKSSQEKPIK